MNLGLIAFANNSGLGNQTRRLAYMLRPDRLLVIDSTPFSKNRDQHFEWYEGFNGYRTNGFPNNREVTTFMKGLSHVIMCENPLNFHVLTVAKAWGIKTYIQSNYEFCDHLDKNLELPHLFLMPSYWKVQEMKERFGDDKVMYLPPPTDPAEFKNARERNFNRKGPARILHIIGTLASKDRNGTLDLLEAIKHCKTDFQLIIRSQHELPREYLINDHRVRYEMSNVQEPEDMYRDFDFMVLPRRYGGLCLSMNEALLSGLPVIMSDVSPNNEILPSSWLVPAQKHDELYTRTIIDVYKTDPIALAQKIDYFVVKNLDIEKTEAFDLGFKSFAPSVLNKHYLDILT